MANEYFNSDERRMIPKLVRTLLRELGDSVSAADVRAVHAIIAKGIEDGHFKRDQYGINPTVRNIRTAVLLAQDIAPDRNMTIAVLLYNLCRTNPDSINEIQSAFGDDIIKLINGLLKVSQLYVKQAAVQDDNFHKLLLTFADDIRVIIIMIVDRLGLMRVIDHHPNEKFVRDISSEARYLYAPLAHRLGLYPIKTELEDLSLKYLNRKVYNQISAKLSESKAHREQYVRDFIKPIKEALDKSNIKYEIKGRTKSINSIWNKMRKKDIDLNGMYDLFAIRIILDTDQEKRDCWIAYSIVTDIYTANVSRLKDWITIPKSNGYESLHITVQGPDDRWVEVQIRTTRMDGIAERGLAAHWKYKGIKSEGELDQWMNNVREVLEAGDKGPMALIRDMNMNLYDKEIFVFTPKGDLFKLPQGASILDFAFAIHSRVGCTCVGGKVDGKNQKLNYKLKSGDTVEILTSSSQMPRQDWVNYVVTSKARNKIRQAVNEARLKKADMARELLQRRFKNRKIEIDEATMTKLVKKLGYKNIIDFYVDVNEGNLDVGEIIDQYVASIEKANAVASTTPHEAAENFVLQTRPEAKPDDDVLVIDNNIKGIFYKFSKCCSPIMGDDIVGFVASDGAIKIHRTDCGNVRHLLERYPYRMIRTQWSGKLGAQFATTLKVVGLDDIGIVSNITSVINKDGDTVLRSISINSDGNLFQGRLVVGVSSISRLDDLIKKLMSLKGVKYVERVNV